MKRKCAPRFVAVQPVQFACGHRYHEVSEEVFYIIRDHAAVRTPEGEKNLKKGMRSLRMSVPASCPMWCTSRIRLPEWYVLPPACTISRSPEQYSCSGSVLPVFPQARSAFTRAAPGEGDAWDRFSSRRIACRDWFISCGEERLHLCLMHSDKSHVRKYCFACVVSAVIHRSGGGAGRCSLLFREGVFDHGFPAVCGVLLFPAGDDFHPVRESVERPQM